MTFLNIIRIFIRFFNYFCMAYTLILSLIYLIQLFTAFKKVRKQEKRKISEDYMRYADSPEFIAHFTYCSGP